MPNVTAAKSVIQHFLSIFIDNTISMQIQGPQALLFKRHGKNQMKCKLIPLTSIFTKRFHCSYMQCSSKVWRLNVCYFKTCGPKSNVMQFDTSDQPFSKRPLIIHNNHAKFEFCSSISRHGQGRVKCSLIPLTYFVKMLVFGSTQHPSKVWML